MPGKISAMVIYKKIRNEELRPPDVRPPPMTYKEAIKLAFAEWSKMSENERKPYYDLANEHENARKLKLTTQGKGKKRGGRVGIKPTKKKPLSRHKRSMRLNNEKIQFKINGVKFSSIFGNNRTFLNEFEPSPSMSSLQYNQLNSENIAPSAPVYYSVNSEKEWFLSQVKREVQESSINEQENTTYHQQQHYQQMSNIFGQPDETSTMMVSRFLYPPEKQDQEQFSEQYHQKQHKQFTSAVQQIPYGSSTYDNDDSNIDNNTSTSDRSQFDGVFAAAENSIQIPEHQQMEKVFVDQHRCLSVNHEVPRKSVCSGASLLDQTTTNNNSIGLNGNTEQCQQQQHSISSAPASNIFSTAAPTQLGEPSLRTRLLVELQHHISCIHYIFGVVDYRNNSFMKNEVVPGLMKLMLGDETKAKNLTIFGEQCVELYNTSKRINKWRTSITSDEGGALQEQEDQNRGSMSSEL